MKNNNKNLLGFTLVELLVVIAIIGILTSVAVVNLNSAREDAKEAAIIAWFSQMQPEIISCLNDGHKLNCDTSQQNQYCGQGIQDPKKPIDECEICNNSNIHWIDITHKYNGWDWTENFDSNVNNYTWTIGATNNQHDITCSENGCRVTNHN